MTSESNSDAFAKLVKIMEELRVKCPWDKKQTIHTLRQMTLEETYELTEAISENNWKSIREELGDLLLHIVFYSKIAEEKNEFTINDVIEGISKKLIDRHPHLVVRSSGYSKTGVPGYQKWFQQIRKHHTPLQQFFQIHSAIPISTPAYALMLYHSIVLSHLLPVSEYIPAAFFAG